MKERPFNMTGQEVRAIRDGRKTQARRIVKLTDPTQTYAAYADDGWPMTCGEDGQYRRDPCPFGTVGDRLWVREKWCQIPNAKPSGYFTNPNWKDRVAWYAADNDKPMWGGKWRPSIHMPRWASRLTLEITDVRVEPLQELSDVDATAEGMHEFRLEKCSIFGHSKDGTPGPEIGGTAIEAFALLWEKINGPGSWDANPFVWVLEFRKVEQ